MSDGSNRVVRVMVGPPAAGKTTYRKYHFPDAYLICPDDFLMIQKPDGKEVYEWSPRASSDAWKKSYQLFGMALRKSQGNILWDATFCNSISRSAILHTAKGFGYEVDAFLFTTPLETCLKRNRSRTPDRQVPEAKIRQFFAQIEKPTTDEGFDRVTEV